MDPLSIKLVIILCFKHDALFSSRQRIQFRPPMEEIKAKYYRDMKKFISIPNMFKGVGDSVGEELIFPAIIDRNASGFVTCFKKAAELFKRLELAQDIFKVIYSIHNLWSWTTNILLQMHDH